MHKLFWSSDNSDTLPLLGQQNKYVLFLFYINQLKWSWRVKYNSEQLFNLLQHPTHLLIFPPLPSDNLFQEQIYPTTQ